MADSNLLLFLFVIFTMFLANEALLHEAIITDQEAYRGQFNYLAAVMGASRDTKVSVLQGGAGVISPKHLLSASQIYIDENGDPKDLSFSVALDVINVNSDNIFLRAIAKIFLPEPGSYKNNDLSVSELAEDINDLPNLVELAILKTHPGGSAPLATLAGYGFNKVETTFIDHPNGYDTIVKIKEGDSDGKLRFEDAQILSQFNCVIVEDLDAGKYFCAKMYSNMNSNDKRRRGFCVLDYGSPLVVWMNNRDTVVGVASVHNRYCENESLGGIYTNVANNHRFITGVLANSLTQSTIVYNNVPLEASTQLENTTSSLRIKVVDKSNASFVVFKTMDQEQFHILILHCFLMGKNTVQAKQWLEKCYGGSAPSETTIKSLVGESIVSKHEAYEGQFTHQAAILGKANDSHDVRLHCGGGIISSKHILAAAQCFVDEYGNHKEFTFYVIVGKIHLAAGDLNLKLIIKIYLPGPGGYYRNDLSVSELSLELQIYNNPWLSKLEIPRTYPGYNTRPGTVSGYGYYWVEIKNGEIDDGGTDLKLRYEKVQILPDRNCARFDNRDTSNYFCGKMAIDEDDDDDDDDDEEIIRGLCIWDYGSPLVMKLNGRKTVVGVASTNTDNCDDENFGGLYANVGANYIFINGVLNNRLAYRTLVYDNRRHEINGVQTDNSTILSMSRLTLS